MTEKEKDKPFVPVTVSGGTATASRRSAGTGGHMGPSLSDELRQMTEIEMEDKAARKPLLDLGWANGWAETPEIVKKCAHRPADVPLGSCAHRVTCASCGYTYAYDSGDCGS